MESITQIMNELEDQASDAVYNVTEKVIHTTVTQRVWDAVEFDPQAIDDIWNLILLCARTPSVDTPSSA